MEDPRSDLDAYAALVVALAARGVDRDAVLAAAGLDEDLWEDIEESWLERLAAAEEAQGEAPGPPALVAAHANALARAERARSGDAILPFERWLAITRAFAEEREVARVLERHGVDLSAYLRAHAHWTTELATSPAAAAKLRRP
jgi:hypothetical protein